MVIGLERLLSVDLPVAREVAQVRLPLGIHPDHGIAVRHILRFEPGNVFELLIPVFAGFQGDFFGALRKR
jgi:hypothetical protein